MANIERKTSMIKERDVQAEGKDDNQKIISSEIPTCHFPESNGIVYCMNPVATYVDNGLSNCST